LSSDGYYILRASLVAVANKVHKVGQSASKNSGEMCYR